MTSEILKVKKRFGHPPGVVETPLVKFFNLRNSKLIFFRNIDFKEQDINGVDMCYADQESRRTRRVDYSAMGEGNLKM